MRRVRLPRAAATELAARYRARAEAERRLVDFLAGVVLVKGLRLEELEGFDDATSELLLSTDAVESRNDEHSTGMASDS